MPSATTSARRLGGSLSGCRRSGGRLPHERRRSCPPAPDRCSGVRTTCQGTGSTLPGRWNTPHLPPAPEHVFVFDTETGGDHAQHLTFGSARLFTREQERLEECLFYADELSAVDRATLQRYAATHDEDTEPLHRQRLRVFALKMFLREVFWRVTLKDQALVVCFNSPFDVSRLSF